MIQSIGFIAGILTTLAFVPQVVKTWRTRSTNDLSLTTLAAFTSGIVLWLVYGWLRHELPIIVANAVTLPLTLVLLYFKVGALIHERRSGRSPFGE